MSLHRTFGLLALVWSSLLLPAAAQVWSARAPMPTPRWGAAAVVLDGQIYVLGGQNAQGVVLDVVERFDPATGTWTPFGSMEDERFNAAAAVFQGKIYVMGGRDRDGDVKDDVQVYDPATGGWQEIDDLEEKREGATAVVLDDTLYVLGGSDQNARFLDTVERFDPATGTWHRVDDWHLDQPRAALGAVVLGDTAYAVGGFSTFGPHGPVQQYSHATGEGLLPPLDPPRGNLGTAGWGRRFYAIGGRDATDRVTPAVNVFDVFTRTWTAAPSLTTGREGAAVALVGEYVFVFGGRDDDGTILASSEALRVNSSPRITSTPDTTAGTGTPYTYTLQTLDAEADPLTITAAGLPGWLTLTDHGDGSATLSGTPGLSDIGHYPITLRVSDGLLEVAQTFTLVVDRATGIDDETPPERTPSLEAPYPNPFARRAYVPFHTAPGATVHLEVFDLQGRRVATLADGLLPPGSNLAAWDGRDDEGRLLASGVYVLRLRQGARQVTRLLTLLR
ncbi:MAG: T9SS C-terminal target domain-containing protein [Bacteroidetes bacterium]|nr:MAG: T9SS C-terminal target domain-containing protein [Bacteroidota bacterium]